MPFCLLHSVVFHFTPNWKDVNWFGEAVSLLSVMNEKVLIKVQALFLYVYVYVYVYYVVILFKWKRIFSKIKKLFILVICLFSVRSLFRPCFLFFNKGNCFLQVYCSFVYVQIVVLYICKRILFLNKKDNVYSGNLSFLCAEPVLLQRLVFAPEISYK